MVIAHATIDLLGQQPCASPSPSQRSWTAFAPSFAAPPGAGSWGSSPGPSWLAVGAPSPPRPGPILPEASRAPDRSALVEGLPAPAAAPAHAGPAAGPAPQGRAGPGQAQGGPGRPHDDVAGGRHRLARRDDPPAGTGQRHGVVEPIGRAGARDPLGAEPRPGRSVRAAGLLQYRADRHGGVRRHAVRAEVDHRGDVRGIAGPPGGRDPGRRPARPREGFAPAPPGRTRAKVRLAWPAIPSVPGNGPSYGRK